MSIYFVKKKKKKKPGHVNSQCWTFKFKGKQLTAQQQPAPTGCTVSMRSKVSSQTVKQNDVESERVREDFEPFVLED